MNTKLPYCVYVLFSDRDHMLYVGYTTDIHRRMREHELGLNKSTRLRGQFHLLFIEYYLFQDDAINREKYFKTSAGKKALSIMLASSLSKLRLKSNHGKTVQYLNDESGLL